MKKVIQMEGIVKKIDDLGRIAIPKEIRRAFRWMGGDELEIIQKDDYLIIKKHQPEFSKRLQEQKEGFAVWLTENDIQMQNDLMEKFQELIDAVREKEKSK